MHISIYILIVANNRKLDVELIKGFRFTVILYIERILIMETFKDIYDRTKVTKRITIRLFVAIKTAIVNGIFLPETRINEIELSQQLDLNVNSFREAMKMLEYDNYIVFNKGNGYFVKDIRFHDLINWFEMIKILTNASVYLININEKTNMIMIEESLKTNNSLNNFLMDKKFHITLAICSRNQQFVRIMDDLYDRMLWAKNTILFLDITPNILSHHNEIVYTIMNRYENNSPYLKDKVDEHMLLHLEYIKENIK